MANNTKKPGKIYFIEEEDQLGYPSSDYLKIGLIKTNGNGRTVEDRKGEHQTGNPRSLIVVDSIETRASVSTLEAKVHQSLAMNRHREEWFIKPNGSIQPFVDEANSIKTQLEELLDLEEGLQQLASTSDSGEEISSDSEASDIHAGLIKLTSEIQDIDQEKKLIEYQLKAIAGTSFAGIAGICSYKETNPPSRFNPKSFQEEHPELFKKYAKEEMSSSFRIRKMPAKKKNEQLSSLKELYESQEEFQNKVNILEASQESHGLHREWLLLHVKRQPLYSQKELLIAKLKHICGTNKGIKDVCSWSRSPKIKLGRSDLKDVPEHIISNHIVKGAATTKFLLNPFRPYKF